MGTKKSKRSSLKEKKQETQKLVDINSMSALEAIEKIVTMAHKSQLSDVFFKKVTPYLQHLAKKQGITEIQALFLSLFVERSSSDNSMDIADIARLLNCHNVSILKYKPQFDELIKAHFIKIRSHYSGGREYYVSKKVI